MSTDLVYFIAGLLTIPAVVFGHEYYKRYRETQAEKEKKNKKG
jgi:hypothetical protein|tara:strand:- start:45 stop:173 length:129 start_codon:yes stop_codon:yes gene_type:complete